MDVIPSCRWSWLLAHPSLQISMKKDAVLCSPIVMVFGDTVLRDTFSASRMWFNHPTTITVTIQFWGSFTSSYDDITLMDRYFYPILYLMIRWYPFLDVTQLLKETSRFCNLRLVFWLIHSAQIRATPCPMEARHPILAPTPLLSSITSDVTP